MTACERCRNSAGKMESAGDGPAWKVVHVDPLECVRVLQERLAEVGRVLQGEAQPPAELVFVDKTLVVPAGMTGIGAPAWEEETAEKRELWVAFMRRYGCDPRAFVRAWSEDALAAEFQSIAIYEEAVRAGGADEP